MGTAAWLLLAAVLVAGCASGQGCQGRTGGWLSGWGNSRGGSAVTVGLHRAWWDCEDRTLSPAPPALPPPAPPGEAMPGAPASLSPSTR